MLNSLLSDAKLFLTFIVLSFLLILFDNFGVFNLPKTMLQTVTSPIQYGLYKTSLGVTRQFEFIFLARRTSQENKALTEQLAQVLSENAQLRKKLAETEGFLEQKNSLSPQEFNLVAARPIGIGRFLVLDKGSNDGINEGEIVIFKDNYIGRVKQVSPERSEVMLTSDPDSKVSAYVANTAGKAKGILMGQFGSEVLLDKILHEEPAALNDLVYSDGLEVEIPKGLILGQVTQVLGEDNDVFKQAKVKPMFDVTNLDVVFVIAN